MKSLGFSKRREWLAQLCRSYARKMEYLIQDMFHLTMWKCLQKYILLTLLCPGFMYIWKYLYYVAFEGIIWYYCIFMTYFHFNITHNALSTSTENYYRRYHYHHFNYHYYDLCTIFFFYIRILYHESIWLVQIFVHLWHRLPRFRRPHSQKINWRDPIAACHHVTTITTNTMKSNFVIKHS